MSLPFPTPRTSLSSPPTPACLPCADLATRSLLAPALQTLLTNLQSSEVHRNIKPQILSAFGDIALAIGDRFEVRA